MNLQRKKVLFLIHDLGEGGAEKVLINLVNNMDTSKFDITVMTLFDVGINKQFLNSKIKYKSCFSKMIRGNSHLMKLLSPEQLHRWLIKEEYDIEVAYLEGPCSRIISGCPKEYTKLVSWIHIEQQTTKRAATSFRSVSEAKSCYEKFHKIVCVSQSVLKDFQQVLNVKSEYEVLYNTNESEKIREQAKEVVTNVALESDVIKIIGVGKLLKSKGFDRILRITKRLINENYKIHLYILGKGPERDNLQRYIRENNLEKHVTMLGYQVNPYKYVSKCDIFVCASYAEGFSTAATEALIVGTPVCTVDVSGMRELLGDNNEYGIIAENNEDAIYCVIKKLLDNQELLKYYKQQARCRGNKFETRNTVLMVEEMLVSCTSDEVVAKESN